MMSANENPKTPTKIALFAQDAFGADAFQSLAQKGHLIAGIFMLSNEEQREDPLESIGKQLGVPVFKFTSLQDKELLREYRNTEAELNVILDWTQLIPVEILNFTKLQNVRYYHPPLPRWQGNKRMEWILSCNRDEKGLSISWAEECPRTTASVFQDNCVIDPDDSLGSLRRRIDSAALLAIAQAINALIEEGEKTPTATQPVIPPYLDEMSDFVLFDTPNFKKTPVAVEKMEIDKNVAAESPQAANIAQVVKNIWKDILHTDVDDETSFFKAGANSIDVIRLLDTIKKSVNISLEKDSIFLSPTFKDFIQIVVSKSRGNNRVPTVNYKEIVVGDGKMRLKVPYQLFIDGKFLDSEDGCTIPVINPADESLICRVQCASINDVNKAVAAAKRAFEGEWSKISARERGDLLFKLAYLLQQHTEELATIETIITGSVYAVALKSHVGMTVEALKYFGGCADKIEGTSIPISHTRPSRNLTFTKKEPIGVCGLITPWNYPMMLMSCKVAACLAAGNTVVIKPAQFCPLSVLKFAELSVEAGFPPGVINVLPGKGTECGQALAAHPDVAKVGFTGSTDVGQAIVRTCAESNLKKLTLELGGKNPLIICSDFGVDQAVTLAMRSVFFNKGENCLSAGRVFVEASMHDEFVQQLVESTRQMRMGDPLDRLTIHGPQNHLDHLNHLLDYVEKGVKEGAKLECGGRRAVRPGLFFEPAIFTGVQDHMFIAREEAFGPIMAISKFDDGDVTGVLKRANVTRYGLAAGVFTKNLPRAMKFAEGLVAGTVFINTYHKTDVAVPFGGFKQSGFGKTLGKQGLEEYLQTKVVTIEY